MIHLLALYGSATLVAALFVGVLVSFEGLTTPSPCKEVEAVLQESVDRGQISQFDADQVTQRCEEYTRRNND